MPTEREAVERERAAWMEGFELAAHTQYVSGGPPWHDLKQRAADRYKLPKVTRPRVVRDPDMWMDDKQLHWRVLGGDICGSYVHPSDSPHRTRVWRNVEAHPAPARVALWAELIERPTEEVEEEGP